MVMTAVPAVGHRDVMTGLSLPGQRFQFSKPWLFAIVLLGIFSLQGSGHCWRGSSWPAELHISSDAMLLHREQVHRLYKLQL